MMQEPSRSEDLMLCQMGSNVFARRVHASSPAEAVGTSGILELPQSFGSIFLGEQFACYISVGNYSGQAVRNVVIKAELQSSRAKVVLHNTGPAPLPQLQPGMPTAGRGWLHGAPHMRCTGSDR